MKLVVIQVTNILMRLSANIPSKTRVVSKSRGNIIALFCAIVYLFFSEIVIRYSCRDEDCWEKICF